jgi:hypothetical protein
MTMTREKALKLRSPYKVGDFTRGNRESRQVHSRSDIPFFVHCRFRKAKNFLSLVEAHDFQRRTRRSAGARRSLTESRIQYFSLKLIYDKQLIQSPDITKAANLRQLADAQP